MKTKSKRILLALLALSVATMVSVMPSLAKDGENWSAPVFIFQSMADLTVYVDGQLSGELTRTCYKGDVVTLTAPESSDGKPFSCWAIGAADGPVASELPAYQLAVNADIVLYAVYGESSQKNPAVAFTAVTQCEEVNGDPAIRFTATYSVPESTSVTGAGILYTDNHSLGVGTKNKLTEDRIDGLDVEALLKDGAEDPRVRRVPASNAGFTLVYNDSVQPGTPYSSDEQSEDYKAVWTWDDNGSWDLNQSDWTLTLESPGEETPVYAVAYVTVGETTYYSQVLTAVYQELDTGVTAVYVPDEMDIADENGITPDDLDAAVQSALALLQP